MESNFIYRDIIDRIAIEREQFPVIWLNGVSGTGKSEILGYLLRRETEENQQAILVDMSDFAEYEIIQSGAVAFMGHLAQQGINIDEPVLILLDNIHYADNLTVLLRRLLEKYGTQIQWIIAGTLSERLQTDMEEELASQYILLPVLPYSFREFLRAKSHEEWLSFLPDEPFALAENPFTEGIRDDVQVLYEEYLLYGGFPEVVAMTGNQQKINWLHKRVSEFMLKDIPALFQINKRHSFVQFTTFLANQQGDLYNEAYMSRTLRIKPETLHNWLIILQDFGLVDVITPHHQNNPNELVKMSKIFFLDTGFRNAFLNNFTPLSSRSDYLNLLEQAVFISLRKYPQWNIRFWRSKQGQHIHFILINEVDLLPIEIKAHTRTTNYVQRWSKRNEIEECFVVNGEDYLQKRGVRYIPAYCI